MFSRLAPSVLLLVVANLIFFCGILFVNGQFVPSLLAPIYDETENWLRLLIFAGMLTIPADFLKSQALRLCGVSLGAPLNMMVGVGVMVAGGAMVEGIAVTPLLVIAALMAMGSCALVAHVLELDSKAQKAGEPVILSQPEPTPADEEAVEARDVG